jgi:hypothetical protein
LAAELYENPREKVSQGDIFELLPHARLDPPLLALEKQSDMILTASGEPFAKFNDKGGQAVLATCRRRRGLLLSHDCEIDKPSVTKWQICPVIPLHTLSTTLQKSVRGNRVFSMLHLPKHWDVLPESYADFNAVSVVDKELILGVKRLTSLSDIGRQALYGQFIRWLTRWELSDIQCPNCSANFDPSLAFPVRTE